MKSRVLVERDGIAGDKLLIHRNSNTRSGKAAWKRQDDGLPAIDYRVPAIYAFLPKSRYRRHNITRGACKFGKNRVFFSISSPPFVVRGQGIYQLATYVSGRLETALVIDE
jgi:hypothetical protein